MIPILIIYTSTILTYNVLAASLTNKGKYICFQLNLIAEDIFNLHSATKLSLCLQHMFRQITGPSLNFSRTTPVYVSHVVWGWATCEWILMKKISTQKYLCQAAEFHVHSRRSSM